MNETKTTQGQTGRSGRTRSRSYSSSAPRRRHNNTTSGGTRRGGQHRRNTSGGARRGNSTSNNGTRSHNTRTNNRRPSSQNRRGGARRGGQNRQRTQANKPHTHTRTTPGLKVPPAKDAVRIIPLGGVEEIGRNMTAVEIGDDIIVIDAGFQFKEDGTPGIDYILPNIQYLEENKDRVRGMLITHGHLDHIGGIPYVHDRIGSPTIYTRKLTSIMIEKRHHEFPHLKKPDMYIVEDNSTVTLGKVKVRFFSVTHTIPDSMGIIIETPYGSVVTPGDYKLTQTDGVPHEHEEEAYKIFEKENVLVMLADSTNVENPGFSTPEYEVHKGFDQIIREHKGGRLIIGAFASQLERLIKIIELAEHYNKKVVVEGRSMRTNIEIAEMAGLFTPKKGTFISAQELESYPPDRIIILATGAQGDEFAAMMRIATKTHKYVRLNENDTVVFSSSIVPGNEKAVQKLKDNIARSGAKIVHYRTSEVYIHASGHGNREELVWLHKKVRPKFFVPIHGNHYNLRIHADLAHTLGMPKDHIIIPDNGTVIDFQSDSKYIVQKEKAGTGMMMVDGFSVGNIQDVVIRDRQALAQDGMFVIIATINSRTGKLRKSPDIISRGFVYLRESQNLLQQARIITKKTIEELTEGMNPINFDFLKDEVTDHVAKFLFQKTNKHPIVIPVLLGV